MCHCCTFIYNYIKVKNTAIHLKCYSPESTALVMVLSGPAPAHSTHAQKENKGGAGLGSSSVHTMNVFYQNSPPL